MTLPKTDKLVPNYDLEKEPLKMIRFGSNMHKKKLSTQTTKTVELSKQFDSSRTKYMQTGLDTKEKPMNFDQLKV